MKFSTQEEYGLRCLIRLAKVYGEPKGLTIPEISRAEGISEANAAKILRILRLGGLLESVRGQTGGYSLVKPPEKILIKEALNILGGRLFDDNFCTVHSGNFSLCTNSIDCSIRSLWQLIQMAVDRVSEKITLKDLMVSEEEVITRFPIDVIES